MPDAPKGLPRLLLVEDDPRLARAIARALRRKVEVSTALDGAEAIRRLVCTGADAILAEASIGVPGGEPFATWLERSMPTWLPRLLLSSAGQGQALLEHFEQRYDTPILLKPFCLDDLSDHVQRMAAAAPPRRSPFERAMARWGVPTRPRR